MPEQRCAHHEIRFGAILDAALHPRWLAATLLPHGMPRFENVLPWLPDNERGLFESAFWIRGNLDKGLNWDRVSRIRDRWKGPLLVKGLLRADDVARAAEIGANGVVISNHGGRQLDWSAAPLDVLPEARAAAGDRMAVLVDGGVRSGGDMAKAIALGADALLVGRAVLYGVAAAGQAGAERALQILRDEFDLTLGLLGCASASDLTRDFLVEEPR